MAREGRFGRLPRAAPDLSSLIVQMVREINAQEDQNYINAWENGGEVNGKKVTDQMLLKHFKSRRDDISKTDPEWEAWDQQISDYTFSIEESKMTLKYAQHKVGEGEMAAFYTRWAKKLPTNGEAYRELMRSAASFADAAANRSTASSGAARQAAYDSAVNASINRYEADFQLANGMLLAAAEREGILQQTSETADWLDLVSGDEQDHIRVLDLFQAIQRDPYYKDIKDILDKQGLEGLTYNQFIGLANSNYHGIENRQRIARQYGDAAGVKTVGAEAQAFNLLMGKIGGWDEMAQYQNLRNNANAQLDGDLDPFEIDALMTSYHDTLVNLRNQAPANEDKGFFNNEIEGLEGRGTVGPTALEGVEGGPRTLGTADSLTMGDVWSTARQGVEMLNSGQYVMQLEQYTDPDDPTGRVRDGYSVISRNDPLLRNPNAGVLTALTTGKGKDARMTPVYVRYHPIMVQIDQTQNPFNAEIEGSNVVGYTYRVNGRDYYAYDTTGPDGQTMRMYSSQNPLKGTNSQTLTGDGLIVSANANDPSLARGAGGTVAFNPTSVLRWNATYVANADDVSEGNTTRYDNPWEPVFDRDPEARQTLMNMTPQQVWQFGAATGDPNAILTIRDLHDTIAERHNLRVDAFFGSLGAVQGEQLGPQSRIMPQTAEDLQRYELLGETPEEHARAVEITQRTNAARYTAEAQSLQQMINTVPGGTPGPITTEQWERMVQGQARTQYGATSKTLGDIYVQGAIARGYGGTNPPQSAIPTPTTIRTPAVPVQMWGPLPGGGYGMRPEPGVTTRPRTEYQFRPGWQGVMPQVATPIGQFSAANLGGVQPTATPRPQGMDPRIFDMQHQIRTPSMPKPTWRLTPTVNLAKESRILETLANG